MAVASPPLAGRTDRGLNAIPGPSAPVRRSRRRRLSDRSPTKTRYSTSNPSTSTDREVPLASGGLNTAGRSPSALDSSDEVFAHLGLPSPPAGNSSTDPDTSHTVAGDLSRDSETSEETSEQNPTGGPHRDPDTSEETSETPAGKAGPAGPSRRRRSQPGSPAPPATPSSASSKGALAQTQDVSIKADAVITAGQAPGKPALVSSLKPMHRKVLVLKAKAAAAVASRGCLQCITKSTAVKRPGDLPGAIECRASDLLSDSGVAHRVCNYCTEAEDGATRCLILRHRTEDVERAYASFVLCLAVAASYKRNTVKILGGIQTRAAVQARAPRFARKAAMAFEIALLYRAVLLNVIMDEPREVNLAHALPAQ